MSINLLARFSCVILLLFAACAPPENSTVSVPDDIEIHYTDSVSGETAIVFVHGWSCDLTYWDAQVEHFTDDYRVVAIDLAGHGESRLSRESWTMASFGADVVTVLEHLGIERAILVGHSMGGNVIAEAAALAPERVVGLIGVDTFHEVAWQLTDEQREMFIAPMREDFAEGTRAFLAGDFMFAPDTDQVLKDRIVEDMAAAPAKVGISAMEGVLSHDLASVIKKAGKPVLCINSDLYPTNVETGRSVAPRFEAKIMSGVGHFLMMERPEEFNSLLAETVRELSSQE